MEGHVIAKTWMSEQRGKWGIKVFGNGKDEVTVNCDGKAANEAGLDINGVCVLVAHLCPTLRPYGL